MPQPTRVARTGPKWLNLIAVHDLTAASQPPAPLTCIIVLDLSRGVAESVPNAGGAAANVPSPLHLSRSNRSNNTPVLATHWQGQHISRASTARSIELKEHQPLLYNRPGAPHHCQMLPPPALQGFCCLWRHQSSRPLMPVSNVCQLFSAVPLTSECSKGFCLLLICITMSLILLLLVASHTLRVRLLLCCEDCCWCATDGLGLEQQA